MISKKKIHKIATILPYKESYTFGYASAVSLWVSEFFKNSIYKNNNFIYGNTRPGKYLTNNYRNVYLNSLRFRFQSTSNEYIEKLIIKLNDEKFDIIEIHNRPLVLLKLIKKIDAKFIMYYHNDPLSMSGSKTISERNEIIEKVDKLIFISKWIKDRFENLRDGIEFHTVENLEINNKYPVKKICEVTSKRLLKMLMTETGIKRLEKETDYKLKTNYKGDDEGIIKVFRTNSGRRLSESCNDAIGNQLSCTPSSCQYMKNACGYDINMCDPTVAELYVGYDLREYILRNCPQTCGMCPLSTPPSIPPSTPPSVLQSTPQLGI